jgi:hypothetical protein
METEVRRIQARSSSKLIAIVVGCLLLASCDDGPTSPSVRTVPTAAVAPTATPVPLPNVAGSWHGTGQVSGPLCSSSDFPATATLSQDGPRVTGSLSTPPSLRTFVGELRPARGMQAAELTGTLTSGATTVTVTGTATSTHMTLRYGVSSFLCGARVELDR